MAEVLSFATSGLEHFFQRCRVRNRTPHSHSIDRGSPARDFGVTGEKSGPQSRFSTTTLGKMLQIRVSKTGSLESALPPKSPASPKRGALFPELSWSGNLPNIEDLFLDLGEARRFHFRSLYMGSSDMYGLAWPFVRACRRPTRSSGKTSYPALLLAADGRWCAVRQA